MTTGSTVIAASELRAFIERFERLDGEKVAISDDQKQLIAELKGRGFDAKAFRAIIRARKKEAHERQEEEAMIELYMEALGMQ